MIGGPSNQFKHSMADGSSLAGKEAQKEILLTNGSMSSQLQITVEEGKR